MLCLCSFEDSRGWCCAAYNEVAIDYNAGFTSAVVRLVEYFEDQKPFSDCGLDLGWEHPNATLVGVSSILFCLCCMAVHGYDYHRAGVNLQVSSFQNTCPCVSGHALAIPSVPSAPCS